MVSSVIIYKGLVPKKHHRPWDVKCVGGYHNLLSMIFKPHASFLLFVLNIQCWSWVDGTLDTSSCMIYMIINSKWRVSKQTSTISVYKMQIRTTRDNSLYLRHSTCKSKRKLIIHLHCFEFPFDWVVTSFINNNLWITWCRYQ